VSQQDAGWRSRGHLAAAPIASVGDPEHHQAAGVMTSVVVAPLYRVVHDGVAHPPGAIATVPDDVA